jgi:hypothetical protein
MEMVDQEMVHQTQDEIHTVLDSHLHKQLQQKLD